MTQEPVCWWNGKDSVVFSHEEVFTPNWTDYWGIPLVRQREWVDLTKQEIKDVCYEVFSYEPYAIALAIQAKLKEKNHG